MGSGMNPQKLIHAFQCITDKSSPPAGTQVLWTKGKVYIDILFDAPW